MRPIRWDLVAKAIDLYEDFGYQYLETPWIVSEAAVNATLPNGIEPCRLVHGGLPRGALVGSAEQGFIDLILKGQIGRGGWISAGPCFRWEEPFNNLHLPTFFKVELIHIHPEPDVDRMVAHAHMVLHELTGGKDIKQVITDEGYDLEIDGIEVGSYGVRSMGSVSWAYGTGLALPRTTFAAKM